MKLSVVIVNYNVKHYLDQCIQSVLRALKNIDSEVIVVDNDSHDGSVDYIRALYPEVLVISNYCNLGFSKANNVAIRRARGEYILLLNPDTFVAEDTIDNVLRFMDSHPFAGGAGVMMHNVDGTIAMESRRGLPSPMTAFYKIVGLCKRYPTSHRFGKYYMGYLPWDSPQQIEVISGAFMMLRRRAIDEVGMLDEDYFMYGEDIDLSYRLLKGGWENWYLPYPILHYKGESTQKTSFRYVHVFYNAMLIFLRKHYSHLGIALAAPIQFAVYLKALSTLLYMWCEDIKKSLGFISPYNADPLDDVMVVDVTNSSYKKIIDMLHHQTGDRKSLGMLYPDKNIIITPHGVVRWKD